VTFATKDDPPFLILHGDKDDVVPYNQSERMDEALKKAGASSVLVKVEGAGHGFGGDEINRRVRQFFDKHLRGVEATISDAPIAAPPRPGSRPDRPAAERP
jgi:dipeptidyl aminopeptidase/acylaminoacyl peptidase